MDRTFLTGYISPPSVQLPGLAASSVGDVGHTYITYVCELFRVFLYYSKEVTVHKGIVHLSEL